MYWPAGLRTFLVFILLVAAPVGAGAQTSDATPKGFVVAFGLSDELNVFHSEATRAAAILAQRYGRGVPPLVYTNTRRAKQATVANLRAALATTAAHMDRDNDVLFLFLTSHGSPKGVVLQAGRQI